MNNLPALMPNSPLEAMQMSDFLSKSDLVPDHLKGKPQNCFLIMQQAMQWGMPFLPVAQCTSIVSGKLMYEGKLVNAVINAMGVLSKRLSYVYQGKGDDLSCTITGTIIGEDTPRVVTVTKKNVQTSTAKGVNFQWQKMPEMMLAYRGARDWARLHCPDVMLGIYTPDEISDIENVTPAHEKVQLAEIQAALSEPARPIEKDWLDWNGEDWSNWASSLNSALDACADNACVTSLAKENAKYMRFLESENPALFAAIKEKSDAVRKKLSEKPSILDVDVAPHDEPQLVDYSQVI